MQAFIVAIVKQTNYSARVEKYISMLRLWNRYLSIFIIGCDPEHFRADDFPFLGPGLRLEGFTVRERITFGQHNLYVLDNRLHLQGQLIIQSWSQASQMILTTRKGYSIIRLRGLFPWPANPGVHVASRNNDVLIWWQWGWSVPGRFLPPTAFIQQRQQGNDRYFFTDW